MYFVIYLLSKQAAVCQGFPDSSRVIFFLPLRIKLVNITFVLYWKTFMESGRSLARVLESEPVVWKGIRGRDPDYSLSHPPLFGVSLT